VRLVLPKPFAGAAGLFEAAARQELTGALRADLLKDLKWYFGTRRAAANRRALTFADPQFWEADVRFNSPRFRQLYRRWLVDGDGVFESLSSPALAQTLERGTGRIESHVLNVSYGHLSPVVSTFRACRSGVEGGDIAVARPRPPSWLRPRTYPVTFGGGVAYCPSWTTDSAPAACAVDLCNEKGRRLVPPPTAVPIATAEEPLIILTCVVVWFSWLGRRRQRHVATERAAGDIC
jgi:hypothetical protein